MARIRSIKPSFFLSEDVAALPLRARLLWIGLWTHCDDAGRAKDNARLIKGAVWPLDNVTLADIEDDLATLADHGRIVRYEVDGRRYLVITNWRDHQAINRPTPSRLPPPPGYPHVSPNVRLTEGSRQEGKGEEGKGGDARASPPEPPPRTCLVHNGQPNPPPCGPCGDARRAHAAWEAERNARVREMPHCSIHRGQLAHNCRGCRADRLAADDTPTPESGETA